MTPDEVLKQATDLLAYANHFVEDDWDYTRDRGDLVAIRYDNRHDSLWGRIKSAGNWLFRSGSGREIVVGRFAMAWFVLHREKHLPDGVLRDGTIITFWEETGEYLQYVQPSVGKLISEWMFTNPTDPYAILVAEEMKRIQDRYRQRLERPTRRRPTKRKRARRGSTRHIGGG